MTKQTKKIVATISDCCMAPIDEIGCCLKCGNDKGYHEIKFDVEVYKDPIITQERLMYVLAMIGLFTITYFLTMFLLKLLWL